MRQLQPAAAHVRMIGLAKRDLGRIGDRRSGFAGRPAVDEHDSGKNERLRTLARLREAALDHQQIQPSLHGKRLTLR